jgi:CO/xanthine dehydrogenase FAD-binding subunit
MIVGIDLPRDATQWRASYHKLRLRDSFDFPELGIAAAVRFQGANVAEAKLVANALEMKPVILDDIAQRLVGAPLTDDAIGTAAREAEQSVRPVKNTNLPPAYRKAMVRVYTERALRELRA